MKSQVKAWDGITLRSNNECIELNRPNFGALQPWTSNNKNEGNHSVAIPRPDSEHQQRNCGK